MTRISQAFFAFGALALAGAAHAADLQRGKAVFDRWCAGCHEAMTTEITWTASPSFPRGRGDPPAGTYILQQRYKGQRPAALEQRTDLTPALVKAMVRNGLNIMPRVRKTEIDDAELDDLAAYLSKTNK